MPPSPGRASDRDAIRARRHRLVAVVVAVFWLVRRFSPPVSCPHCGSTAWIILGEMKECRGCGRIFY